MPANPSSIIVGGVPVSQILRAGQVLFSALVSQIFNSVSDSSAFTFNYLSEVDVSADTLQTTSGSSTIDITGLPEGHRFRVNDPIQISGASAFNGIAANDLNTTHTITAIAATSASFAVPSTASGSGTGGGSYSLNAGALETSGDGATYWEDAAASLFSPAQLPPVGSTIIISNLIREQDNIPIGQVTTTSVEFLRNRTIRLDPGGYLVGTRFTPVSGGYVSFDRRYEGSRLILNGGTYMQSYNGDNTDQDAQGIIDVVADSTIWVLGDFNVVRYDELRSSGSPNTVRFAGVYSSASSKNGTMLFRAVNIDSDLFLTGVGNPYSNRDTPLFWSFRAIALPTDRTLSIRRNPTGRTINGLRDEFRVVISGANPNLAGTVIFEASKTGSSGRAGDFKWGESSSDLVEGMGGTGTFRYLDGEVQCPGFNIAGAGPAPRIWANSVHQFEGASLIFQSPVIEDQDFGGTVRVAEGSTLDVLDETDGPIIFGFDDLEFFSGGGTISANANLSFGNLILNAAGTVSPFNGKTFSLTGSVSGASDLTIAGAGTFTPPDGQVDFNGIDVSSGNLNVPNSSSIGVSSLVGAGGSIANGLYIASDIGDANITGGGLVNVGGSAVVAQFLNVIPEIDAVYGLKGSADETTNCCRVEYDNGSTEEIGFDSEGFVDVSTAIAGAIANSTGNSHAYLRRLYRNGNESEFFECTGDVFLVQAGSAITANGFPIFRKLTSGTIAFNNSSDNPFDLSGVVSTVGIVLQTATPTAAEYYLQIGIDNNRQGLMTLSGTLSVGRNGSRGINTTATLAANQLSALTVSRIGALNDTQSRYYLNTNRITGTILASSTLSADEGARIGSDRGLTEYEIDFACVYGGNTNFGIGGSNPPIDPLVEFITGKYSIS